MVHFFIGSLTQKILNSIHYDNTNMFATDRFCAVKPEMIGTIIFLMGGTRLNISHLKKPMR